MKGTIDAVNDLAKSAVNVLNEAKQLLDNTANLVIEAKKDFGQIGELNFLLRILEGDMKFYYHFGHVSTNLFFINFFVSEYEATRVVAAKNSLNDSINEQAVKLEELDDAKNGADIHAEALAKRVRIKWSTVLSFLLVL